MIYDDVVESKSPPETIFQFESLEREKTSFKIVIKTGLVVHTENVKTLTYIINIPW